ncbi:MAG: hypothetical protein JST82_12970 [Bacteroidetes bacterium]|nr:hypothetical protein [Bacteroidota bacterium]
MNNKTLPFLLLAVVLIFAIPSCKKADKQVPVPENQDYFPLQLGKYVIYNVDSTIWDDTNCVKVVRHYQMMWRVVDTFTDGQNRPSMRMEVSIRKKATDLWTLQYVMYATNTGQELELAYSDLRFIKMVYPIAQDRVWDGNAYINTNDADLTYFKGWNYRYINVGLPFGNGDVTYDNTVTVLAIDQTVNDPYPQPKDAAVRTFGEEVFAKGIGMVYREYYRWTYDPNSTSNMDINNKETRCLKGDGVVMRAVDHN